MPLHIIILAAGQGQRMRSSTPKVLHSIAGQSMLEHVIRTAQSLKPQQIHVVIGHAGAQIQAAFSDSPVHWVEQQEQLGTGHAVLQALPHIPPHAKILVLYADTPLLRSDTLAKLLYLYDTTKTHQPLALLLAYVPNPYGFGRIVRDSNQHIMAIVEEKDANEQQRLIAEIYPGICCTSAENLRRWLPKLSPKNAQKELYLTDIVAMARAEQHPIPFVHTQDYQDILGVNDRAQLQQAERIWQQRQARELMLSGVTLADANRIDIRGTLTTGRDVFIDINNVFIGNVHIGEGSLIEPNCVLTNVTIGANTTILASSVLADCVIGDHCHIGPFTHIRPGTKVAAHCKIGNFVEAKKAVFGEHSKASHLSYLGDVSIGSQVNIGAGTITCNYDGVHKHQTIIEDGAFIGSDTQLVAPVTIGRNATIGAGSTIRSDAPPNELTLTVSKQKTIYGWQKKEKENKDIMDK